MLKTINIIKSIKDCIFPVFCLNCKKEGCWLCPECFVKIEINIQKACPICHRYNNNGKACLKCEKHTFLDSHLAIMKYEEDKIIGELVRSFKYHYAEEIFDVFKKIISDFLPRNFSAQGGSASGGYYFEGIDLIIPVPLHGRRLAERGFNQAELIADAVAGLIGKEVEKKAIVRQRYTSVQARLNRNERMRNVSGAFALNLSGPSIRRVNSTDGRSRIKDKNILLVDDVFTTGSTLQECAKLLKKNGAKKALGFSLARG